MHFQGNTGGGAVHEYVCFKNEYVSNETEKSLEK